MEKLRAEQHPLALPEIENHRRIAMAGIMAGLFAMNLFAWLLFR